MSTMTPLTVIIQTNGLSASRLGSTHRRLDEPNDLVESRFHHSRNSVWRLGTRALRYDLGSHGAKTMLTSASSR